MQIIIADTNELTELDLRVLRALVGAESAEVPVSGAKAASAAPAKAEADEAAQKPEKKAAPAKAAKKPEPEPDEEPEDDETEDGDEAAPTLKDAVALATKLVSGGQAKEVKAALTALGAKRVSELKESDVPAFISSLS